jgi:hypothetical protein
MVACTERKVARVPILGMDHACHFLGQTSRKGADLSLLTRPQLLSLSGVGANRSLRAAAKIRSLANELGSKGASSRSLDVRHQLVRIMLANPSGQVVDQTRQAATLAPFSQVLPAPWTDPWGWAGLEGSAVPEGL